VKSEKTTRNILKPPPKTFVLLYKVWALPLMKFLVKRTGGDQQAAEEVFSRTMIAAWQGMHTFEHKSQFFTWICRIALNKLADYYREQIHHNSLLIAPTLEEFASIRSRDLSPEEKLVLNELKNDIRECLHLLPDDKRQLLYMRFWKGLTIKKIASITRSSERAVEGKIYRSKQELKNFIRVKRPDLQKAYLKTKK
jgi:RNA polymerase sigma-70 factor (ECF subfamily)